MLKHSKGSLLLAREREKDAQIASSVEQSKTISAEDSIHCGEREFGLPALF
jgi:hypothetical protein